MKKILTTSVYMLVLAVSNMAYGMSNENQSQLASADAFSALQITRSVIQADLEKNIQASLCAMPAQRIKGFGIDDTESYAHKQKTTIGQYGVEG
jgi:hypothetical protein